MSYNKNIFRQLFFIAMRPLKDKNLLCCWNDYNNQNRGCYGKTSALLEA